MARAAEIRMGWFAQASLEQSKRRGGLDWSGNQRRRGQRNRFLVISSASNDERKR